MYPGLADRKLLVGNWYQSGTDPDGPDRVCHGPMFRIFQLRITRLRHKKKMFSTTKLMIFKHTFSDFKFSFHFNFRQL